MLSKKLPVVRAVDIATELNFKKSSVSVAMKKLRESEHIIVSREGYITLTESGQAIADMIYERHTLLSSWLERLGVDPQVADSRLHFSNGDGGIRTLVPRRANAFRVRPVMTTSIQLHMIFSALTDIFLIIAFLLEKSSDNSP